MSTTVIREVASGIWTFSRPFARSGLLPVGGRSTAIKLSDGGVWVLASTPLETETKSKIDELGPVKYIIGPDSEHTLFLGEFKKAYPNAKLIAVEEAASKVEKDGLKLDGSWGGDPIGTQYGFEDDIQHCHFNGFINKDVAFFHAKSKTLIEADLLHNLPPTEQYSKSPSSGTIPFLSQKLTPYTWFHKKFLWATTTNEDAMKQDAKIVAGWDFERIIPCHGDVIEKDGKKAWTTAFGDFLN